MRRAFMTKKNYYIGLDVGTDSVGWAVTNEDYSLCKFKGNAMWGIRLLEESKTAEERRNFRSSRRRTQRNKYRLQCLEMLFNREIAKVDVAFFQRLKESNLYEEDKTTDTKYSVFNDRNYTDKDYHKQYPTIYHLRRDLIQNKEPHDVRLVYLAIAHIIKHRGHFLFDSDFNSDENAMNFKTVWDELNLYIKDNYNLDFQTEEMEELEVILKDRSLTITAKKKKIEMIFGLKKKEDRQRIAIVGLLTGGKINASDLYDDESLKDSDCKKVCISTSYDENAEIYENAFKERFELIEKIKAVYDWSILANILNDENYLSFAKVNVYNKHKRDLKRLKSYIKTYCPDKYDLVFNVNEKGVCNYVAYTKHSKHGSAEETNCTIDKFSEYLLKKVLPKEVADSSYQSMYDELSNCTFLPKMVTKDNSVVPMQVTKKELKVILENASSYLEFLNDRDEKGLTVKDKIESIHSYRIPYYVGPLNPHSDKSWIIRKEGKIYPWNMKDMIDYDQSAESFIKNLTSKCTYLPEEDVLPKNSLLYSAFMVLNEINNIKLDGEKISVEVKQRLYNELFMKKAKVSLKAIQRFFVSLGYKDFNLTGIDTEVKASLKPFLDLQRYPLSLEEKEEIIKTITIFGDDKKLMKKRITNIFGDCLSKEEIKTICKLKYTGWSRLSNRFLMKVYSQELNSDTGEVFNIINMMWMTNNNLMQLLSNQYDYLTRIEEINSGMTFTSLKQEVESLYVSPKVKRPIYQAMQIVEEIIKIQGCEPKKIFVEVARGEGEKKRTTSRKARLLELYKSCRKEEEQLYNQLQKFDEADFRRDALYLYFTQFGRCMYTKKEIKIEDLYNRNIYDIDHIFPRSKIKDDSLDNRVLVIKNENLKKDNEYPISEKIRINMHDFWSMLLNKDLITQTKYDRLVRNTPLSDEELSGFISRQLVETRQSTKAIAQLLEKRYHHSKIVYVKANLVSDFRRDNDMLKSRDVNDLHHAKDAYLNIVVGNVYHTQFTSKFYIKELQNGTKSVKRIFNYPVKGAWITKDEESMKIVKKTMSKNNIRFTRYAFKQKGGLFDQNILKKGNGQVSIKSNSPRSDISKYGGYNRASSSYFSIVKYMNEKGKMVMQMIPIDSYQEQEYSCNPIEYLSNCTTYLPANISRLEVIVPCVKYNTLLSINGFRMHISSKSSGGKAFVCKPAVQLVLGYDQEKYIKRIASYLNKCVELKKVKDITDFDKLTKEENEVLYNLLIDKMNIDLYKRRYPKLSQLLKDGYDSFSSLSIHDQCVVIIEILNILHANVRTGDLKLIGGASKSGVLSIGNKIEKSKTATSFKIIYQSITGLFEKEVELLD